MRFFRTPQSAGEETSWRGNAPVAGLAHPKRDEKLPFMTREQIEHLIEGEQLAAPQAMEL